MSIAVAAAINNRHFISRCATAAQPELGAAREAFIAGLLHELLVSMTGTPDQEPVSTYQWHAQLPLQSRVMFISYMPYMVKSTVTASQIALHPGHPCMPACMKLPHANQLTACWL